MEYMVNLFLFGCHVTERTYASTDCTGRVGETSSGDYQKEGRGISGVSWQIHIFYIAHSQYGQLTTIKMG